MLTDDVEDLEKQNKALKAEAATMRARCIRACESKHQGYKSFEFDRGIDACINAIKQMDKP